MKVLATTSLMHRLLLPALSVSALISTRPAFAADVPLAEEVRETIVHKTTTVVNVDLNEKTVLCSRADYALPMLKVLIPGLTDITLLDHQNYNAAAPCVTTGESCTPRVGNGAKPEDILQGRPGVEQIEVTVTAKKIEYIDRKEKTCLLEMVETVETNIRGKRLFHEKRNELQPRMFERCAQGGV